MAKTLRVINSFFIMEEGDIMELSKDGSFYVAQHNEEFHKHGDDAESVNSTFSSTFTISVDYAKQLIREGFLEEVNENIEAKPQFVNIFTEIDNLIEKYTKELNDVDKTMADAPQCMKVEKVTVLNNMIALLVYLKNLKK